MAGIFGIDEDKFLPIYRSSRNPYDRGDFTGDTYWAEFARRAGVTIHANQVESLRRLDREMWSNVNEEMTEWLASIHSRGIKTAILSNMQTDMAAHVRKNFAWLRHFDHQIFIRGIVFESVERLRKDLQALGFPILPGSSADGNSHADR